MVFFSCKENGAQKMLLKLFFQIYGKENTDERTGRFMKKPKHKLSGKGQGWSALFEVIKEICGLVCVFLCISLEKEF